MSRDADKSMAFQPLKKKIEKSVEIVSEVKKGYEHETIAIAWTGGKDSTTLLSIVRTMHEGRVPFKVLNIDTSVKFKEIYEFRNRLIKAWDLDVVVLKHPEAERIIRKAQDPGECCSLLKTGVLDEGIKKYGIKALMTGIRWDEHPARADETYFSERGDHVRVNPLLHFMERDIWSYIKENDIPYCELYDKGYRSLGCAPCTTINTGSGPERGGRAQDKEKIMENLRELGYF